MEIYFVHFHVYDYLPSHVSILCKNEGNPVFAIVTWSKKEILLSGRNEGTYI